MADRAEPLPIGAWLQVALEHHRAGRLPEAEAGYREILAREPGHADALHLLGVIAYQIKKYEVASALIEQAIAVSPTQAAYRTTLARVKKDQGQWDEAIAHYRAALQLQPDAADVHHYLGNALLEQGLFESAQACYREALKIRPDYVEVHNNLGNALQAQQKFVEAQASYRQALALRPGFVPAQVNLGNALQASGALQASLVQYRAALAVQPELAEAHSNLGNALKALHRGAEAIEHYRRAIALKPTYAEAYCNLGAVLQEQGLIDEAMAQYRVALALRPNDAIGHNNLGLGLASQGKFNQALAHFRQALALKPDFDVAHSNMLFHLNYASQLAAPDYLAEARAFGAKLSARAAAYTTWERALDERGVERHARLRVGFVSGDLRDHPVGCFLESVLATMDPRRFELIAYATQPIEDDLTRRLRRHFAQWHSLVGLSDQAAAARIHHDGIQILVDLAGHTADNRLPVFAYKPAPVQVAWLGYFASTGVQEIDYVLADRHVLPVAEESHFTEKPWRLPDCYLCFTPPYEDIAVGPLPRLSRGGQVTFGCFNKLGKMNDRVVSVWSRVLLAVPGSRLVLKAKELTDGSAQAAARGRFEAHGIAGHRIETLGYSTREHYLATYGQIDIALDPFPYPGATTTVEALWMGVPVLSLRGERFLSHAGESLLGTVGLSDWVAASEDEYVTKAAVLSQDASGLAALRARLRVQLLNSPLCDAPRFAENLGAAFEGMWSSYRAKGR